MQEDEKFSTNFLKRLDQTVTKEALTRSIEELLKFLVAMQKRNDVEIQNLQETYAQVVNTLKEEHGGDFEETKKMCADMVQKMMYEHKAKMKAMDDKMAEMKNGDPGADADEEKVMEMVLAKIPPMKELEPETAEGIRDKLETLMDGEKLSIQAIEGLAKILEELSKSSTRVVRGGVGPLVRFIDDETPTGTVNGSNTVFTISKAVVSGSLKVYVNGQRMRVTEDYTFSGKTITFLTAPPTGSILLVDFRY